MKDPFDGTGYLNDGMGHVPVISCEDLPRGYQARFFDEEFSNIMTDYYYECLEFEESSNYWGE